MFLGKPGGVDEEVAEGTGFDERDAASELLEVPEGAGVYGACGWIGDEFDGGGVAVEEDVVAWEDLLPGGVVEGHGFESSSEMRSPALRVLIDGTGSGLEGARHGQECDGGVPYSDHTVSDLRVLGFCRIPGPGVGFSWENWGLLLDRRIP